MSGDLWRYLIGILILAHGIGQTIFLVSMTGVADWRGGSGKSWLLSNLLGDGATRLVAAVVWLALTAGFLAASAGILSQQTWWRPLVVIAAAVALLAQIIFWDSAAARISFGPTVNATAMNIVILVALLALKWPSASVVGS